MSAAVRAGYKMTEVGVIPEDWDVANLQEVCAQTITYGIVQCGPHIESGVPYIRVSDMNSPNLDVTGMLKTSLAIASQFSRSQVSVGDVVYALRGKIGEVRIVDQSVAGANLTQGTARLSPSDRVDSTYLLYCLRSQSALRQGGLAAKGSTFREITLESLRQIELPIAPIPEQRAIATALSDVDALLAKLDALIDKKRDLKVATMQQLLTGQTRLPGFSGEWEVKRFSEICHMKSGEGITSADIDEHSKYPCYGGNGLRGYATSYTHEGAHALIGRQGALCGNVLSVGGQFFASEHAIVVTSFNGNDIQWLAVVLERMKLNQYSESSAQPGLSVSRLLSFSSEVPPVEEQIAIATVLSDMDIELNALEARRDKTRALKQGMMQELLTGRIRLV